MLKECKYIDHRAYIVTELVSSNSLAANVKKKKKAQFFLLGKKETF